MEETEEVFFLPTYLICQTAVARNDVLILTWHDVCMNTKILSQNGPL